jgi:hypothetical protein
MKDVFIEHLKEKEPLVKNKWYLMKEFSDDFTELNNNFYSFYGSVEATTLISFIILDYTEKITKEYAVILSPLENTDEYVYNLIHIMYFKNANKGLKDYKQHNYNKLGVYKQNNVDKLWDDLNKFMTKEPQLIEF